MDIDNNNNHDKANHCVYISFDSNDPSISSFINYLKATINRHGIYQLDDHSDQFAERIRLLVVVFSKNYTFYAPEKLVNHLKKKDLVVVPVLHAVKRSSAAAQQILKLDQVTMWQRGLLDTTVLPAYVYNEERSEYEFMEEIARDVCEKLYPTEEIGIHRLQDEIENLLCEQPWGVRTLGISGKPDNIGKKTLAISVFRHMSGGYDASLFIKDFHTKYNEDILEPLDPEYFSETPMEKFDLNSVDSEPSNRKKRVLIALDDVRDAEDVKSFLGGFNKFGPGSLIIITSTDKQVLEECQMSEIYELKGLTEEEAQMGSALPDVCEVLITGLDVSCDTAENKYMQLIPYEEYDEAHENKEFTSDHNAVLATRGTETITLTPLDLCSGPEIRSHPKKNLRSGLYSRFSKSLPSNLEFTDWIIIL